LTKACDKKYFSRPDQPFRNLKSNHHQQHIAGPENRLQANKAKEALCGNVSPE
jgi:hypothetical protein